MSDGRPLTLRITGNGAGLWMSFMKAGEGLWAEGPVRVCRRGSRVTAEIAGADLVLGPAASWAARPLFAVGAVFELAFRDTKYLQVAAPGWSGEFEEIAD